MFNIRCALAFLTAAITLFIFLYVSLNSTDRFHWITSAYNNDYKIRWSAIVNGSGVFKTNTTAYDDIPFNKGISAYRHMMEEIIPQLDFIARNLSQQATPDQKYGTIVHYSWFYGARKPGPDSQLTFLQCISVLSVMVNLRPHAILLHTDQPKFWPFESCRTIIGNWSTVHLVYSPLKGNINGRKIGYIEHEADILKLEKVAQHGGIALDFDVFIIDGPRIRQLLETWPCIICLEIGERVNNGFLACNKNASYPNLVLTESYYQDYRPSEWVWNIGTRPLQIYKKNPTIGMLVNEIANQPPYSLKNRFLFERGRYNWTGKMAHHSFHKDKNFTLDSLKKMDSSFGDMLTWILYVAKNSSWIH